MRLPPALLLTGNTALRCVPVVPTAAGIRTCVRYLTPREAFRTNLPGQPQKSTTDSVGGGCCKHEGLFSLGSRRYRCEAREQRGWLCLRPLFRHADGCVLSSRGLPLCTSVSWSPLFIRTPVQSYRIMATLATPFNLRYFFKSRVSPCGHSEVTGVRTPTWHIDKAVRREDWGEGHPTSSPAGFLLLRQAALELGGLSELTHPLCPCLRPHPGQVCDGMRQVPARVAAPSLAGCQPAACSKRCRSPDMILIVSACSLLRAS